MRRAAAARGRLPLLALMTSVFGGPTPCQSLDNGLGRTPPLGWSSWNYFATHINETLFREMADAMVSTGLADAGFQYINIDAGYLLHSRDANGSLVVNPALFPSGMRSLADYVHGKGLKLGVYTDLTSHSCGPGPGSYQHYEQDARTIALEWTADFLKVDYCGSDVDRAPAPQLAGWSALRDALNATGRPVYFSICPHAVAPATGPAQPYHGASVYSPPAEWTAADRAGLANSLLVEYTNTFDLWYAEPTPAGDGGPMDIPGGVLTNIDAVGQMTNLSFSGPGSWNDADMLQVCTFGEGATRHFNSTGRPGNYGPDAGGMTMREYEAHYAIWAVWGSPLIHGADLRTVGQRHPQCLELMLNPELLAVNQDKLGAPARTLYTITNVSSSSRSSGGGGSGSGSRSSGGGGSSSGSRERDANSSSGSRERDANSTQIVLQAWARPLSGGRVAVVLFNRGEGPTTMRADFSTLGLPPAGTAAVRDVLRRTNAPDATGAYEAKVQPHGVAFVVLTLKAR